MSDKQKKLYKNEYLRLIKIIKDKYSPDKIYVFGSFAEGNFGKDSDLDLFIVKNTKKVRRERNREVSRLLIDRKMPVDILVFSPSEIKERNKSGDFFIKNILKNGKLVYAK